MPKLMYFLWVKNVNNVFINGWVSGVLLSPVVINSVQLSGDIRGKVSFTHINIHLYITVLSTQYFVFFNLLKYFYTHNPQHLLLEQLQKI
jgi:hypothetical protein